MRYCFTSAVFYVILLLSLSLGAQSDSQGFLINEARDTILTGISTKLIGRTLSPDSIQPPVQVRMQQAPTIIPAHPNIRHIDSHGIWPEEHLNYPEAPGITPDMPRELTFATLTGPSETGSLPAKTMASYSPKPSPTGVMEVGDNATYDIRSLSTNLGLPSSHVYDIHEDYRGYIWIASHRALSRYDGDQLIIYDDFSYLVNHPMQIAEDTHQNLWFYGTFNNGTLVRFDGHRFHHYQLPHGNARIFADSHGNLWVSIPRGLLRLSLDQDGSTLLVERFTKSDGLGLDNIFCFTEDRTGNLWMGGNVEDDQGTNVRGGMVRFDPESGVVTHFIRNRRMGVSDILADSKGLIWFLTNGFVIRYDPSQIWTGTNFEFIYRTALGGTVHKLIEDHEGDIWLSYDGTEGFFKLEYGEKLIPARCTHITTREGLSNPLVNSMMVDSKGKLWIGTRDGLNRFDLLSFRFMNQNSGLLHNNVYSIAEDRDGHIWFSHGFRGTVRYDGDQFLQLTEANGLAGQVIRALLQDSRGHYWTVGHQVTRFILDPGDRDGMFYHYNFEQGLNDDHAWALLEDQQGYIWFGHGGGGITRHSPSKNEFTHFTTEDGLSSNFVFALLEDSEGYLWFGTWHGLSRYDPESENIIHFGEAEGLSAYFGISSLYQDSQGHIWIGGQQVSRYTPGENGAIGSFENFTTSQGLIDEIVSSIKEDAEGHIWIITGKGIMRLMPSNDSILHSTSRWLEYHLLTLGRKDGLKDVFHTGPPDGALVDSKNRIWWGNQSGATYLELDAYEAPVGKPEVHLEHIEIRGVDGYLDYSKYGEATDQSSSVGLSAKELNFDSTARYHNYPINLTLSHNRNQLTFHFAAIDWSVTKSHDLSNTPRALYSVFMEGLDTEWSPPSPENKIYFSSLQPGSYTLNIKAIGSANVWSDPFEYSFRIKPPWWSTWWAYTLYGLLILGVLWQFYMWRTQAQRKRLAEVEQMNTRLTQLDKLKDQFLANTSHELRTPLNGIIGIAESLRDGIAGKLPGKANSNLNVIIASGKRLANLVNDVLDFSKLKNQDLILQLRPVDMHSAVDIVLTLSEPVIQHKDLSLINGVPRDVALVEADENRVQQILHNLVGNAIKFTEKGKVSVRSSEQDDMLRIEVKDTGIGIAEEKFESIFQSFEQGRGDIAREYGGTGLGLSVTRQLVELHGGRIGVESEVGKGSMFWFTLPVSREKRERLPDLKFTLGLEERVSQTDVAEQSGPVESEEVISIANDAARILIVDDEPVNLQVLENHLSLAGYQVTQAINGTEALGLVEAEPPFDLVMLDIMMPNMSGYEVCHKLRERYLPGELPVVMLTAKNRVSDLVEGFSVGANDYLTKPFSKDELLTRIKTHLNLHRIHRSTGKFVPFEFLKAVGREQITDVQLGDHTHKEVTVLFSDIRDFTSLAEKMTPEENFRFVSRYVAEMGPIVRRHEGFINQYQGDGIMAIFPRKLDQGLQAAIEMQQQIQEFNQTSEHQITVGIGLHSGPLIMGIIGDAQRNEPTTIADTVNAASRIEGLTKHYGARILVTEASLKTLKEPGRFHFRYLGKVQVKGKEQAMGVFECINGDVPTDRRGKMESLKSFEMGMEQFYSKQFAQAVATFDEILQANETDQISHYFRNLAARYTIEGVSEDWQGVEKLTTK